MWLIKHSVTVDADKTGSEPQAGCVLSVGLRANHCTLLRVSDFVRKTERTIRIYLR